MMLYPDIRDQLHFQRDMSFGEVLRADLLLLLTGIILALVLLVFAPVIWLGILGECEYAD